MSGRDRILSDEESEALLAASADRGEPDSAAARAVRGLDLDHWEQIAPDRVPALEALNDELARSIETLWNRFFKREIVASPVAARRRNGSDYAAEIASPECVVVVDIKSQPDPCLFVFAADTVSAMVDQFFGSTGTFKRSQRLTGLTEMEGRLMHRFSAALSEVMASAWSKYSTVALAVNNARFEPELISGPDGPDHVFVSALKFDIGENAHSIEIVLPESAVDSLRKPRVKAIGSPQKQSALDWSARLREDIKDARVVLRAVLGETPITLRRIANAQPGDIITTDALSSVKIYAGHKAVLAGTLGTHRGFNAVKISGPVNQKLFGDD